MKVLVTGHNGYIGSVMTKVLQRAGHIVGGIDNNYFTENPLDITPCKLPMMQKDIRDIVPSDIKGFDAIIHLAALSNDPMAKMNVDLTYDINLFATLRLAQVAKFAGVKKFLFSSSCSVYGAGSISEDGAVCPLSAYAVSKIRSEEGLAKLADNDFHPVFLRNGTAYGSSPRHRTDLVLNSMVLDAFSNGCINIIGDGTLRRPIVHIEDISQAFLLALEAPDEVVHGQVFNVGSNSENYMVREIANIVKEIIPSSEIKYTENKGDARSYQVDFSKIRRVLGFEPSWDALHGALQLLSSYTLVPLYYHIERLKQLDSLIAENLIDLNLRWRTQ